MTAKIFLDKLFNNWQAKLISLGLAFILYFGFQLTSIQTETFSVPLIIQEGGHYILVGNVPSFVRIEVKGNNEEVVTLEQEDFYAYIDTSFVTKEGSTRLPIRLDLKNNAAVSKSLDIEVYPDTVQLDFEEKIEKWIPVIPLFKGAPAEGYHQTTWKAEPSDVKITGPKTIVEATNFTYTDGINLNLKKDKFEETVNISIQNNRVILDSDNTVLITVEIEPIIETKSFELTIPRTNLPQEFVLATPIPVISIELSGERKQIENYYPTASIIDIDFSNVTEPGTYTLPVTIHIPAHYTIVSPNTNEITVEIQDAPKIDIEKGEL